MEPCLPQHDPRPGPRARQLAAAAVDYRYEHEGPIAWLEHLPSRDDFGGSYQLKRMFTGFRFGCNLLLIRLRHALRKPSFDDHARHFALFRRKPMMVGRIHDDAVFAWQRLAGANPMDLRRLDAVPGGLPLTNAMLAAHTRPGATLAGEIADGRLYVAEYPELAKLAHDVQHRALDRWLTAPRTLFWLSPDGRFVPVAIQLNPDPTAGQPVFTPSDGNDWLAARLFAQCGDTTSQEMKHHLAQTHLVLGPVAIAARRQLAPHHPIRILLDAHLEFLLAINDFGRRTLICPGGFLDQLMPGWLSETMQLVSDAVGDWSWQGGGFHEDLAARGLDDTPPEFVMPYRDDGQLVWKAIHTFVADYVRLYYPTVEDVRLDAELQRFIEELGREGRARGLPMCFRTADEITDFLVRVVWVAGPKHAAVNYSQWDYIAYVPNMPFAMYGPPPASKGSSSWDPDALAAVLPDREASLKQTLLMEALTGWQHTRLGHYRRGTFRDKRVLPLVRRFQQELEEVEDTIRGRNPERLLPYPYLLPSRIPNSTNT